MIRITFEGTTEDVMKEMKDFVDNRADGVVVEVPKNWTTQGVDPDEPKVEAAAAPAAPVTPVAPVAPVMPTNGCTRCTHCTREDLHTARNPEGAATPYGRRAYGRACRALAEVWSSRPDQAAD